MDTRVLALVLDLYALLFCLSICLAIEYQP